MGGTAGEREDRGRTFTRRPARVFAMERARVISMSGSARSCVTAGSSGGRALARRFA